MPVNAKRTTLAVVGVLTLLSAAWLVRQRTRDPYAFPIEREFLQWRDNDGLQRAISELSVQDRSLLRLWMSRYTTHADRGSLRAHTIHEAIDEIRMLARKDPRLARAMELYIAPRSMVGAGPAMRQAIRGLP